MKLFNYMNQEKSLNVRARFGTVKDYFDELRKVVPDLDSNPHSLFPSLDGDFFPYTDQNSDYWTGYFTTRPFDKNLGRELEINLRAAEILNVLAGASGLHRTNQYDKYHRLNYNNLTLARQALGLFQHHDAITGTAKRHVVVDYLSRLREGIDAIQDVMASAASYLLSSDSMKVPALVPDTLKSLRLVVPTQRILNVDQAPGTIVLFNSVAQAREELVRVTVNSENVVVKDDQGKVILSQMNPIWQENAQISVSAFELVFIAHLPPMSLVTYTIADAHGMPLSESLNYAAYIRLHNVVDFRIPPKIRFSILPPAPNSETIIIENDQYRLWFSAEKGTLQTMTLKTRFRTVATKMELLNYMARGSGAYIFDPAGPAVDAELNYRPVIRVLRGPVTSEVHSVQKLIQHSSILCNSTGLLGSALEINNIVDLKSLKNKEMIMRLSTDMKSHNFYTDLNGFQTVKRKRFSHFHIQANYYPMTTFAYIEDGTSRLTFITAEPHGVGSHEDGALEIMLDRRLLYDDGRGLGEGIQDNKQTPSRFYLLLERISGSTDNDAEPGEIHGSNLLSYPSLTAQSLANNLRNYAIVFFQDPKQSVTPLVGRLELMQQSLPCDVRLVNLRTLAPEDGTSHVNAALILHRVGFQCGFSLPPMACDLTNGKVELHSLFSNVHIDTIIEKTLSLMYTKVDVTLKNFVSLDPMELYVYQVAFH